MTFWAYVWSVLLGVIIGGFITGLVMWFIEWWKEQKIRANWCKNLLYEVRNNYFLKQMEIKGLREEQNNLGFIENINIFDMYKNNFELFNAFLKSGCRLKNETIILDYSNYIVIQIQVDASLDSTIKKYLRLGIIARKMKENIEILNSFILLQETQYKIIEKVLDLLILESKTGISKNKLKFKI